jgi:hypothetical protein
MSIEFRPLIDCKIFAESLSRSNVPFVVAAMFTADIRLLADRLKASLERVGLNFVLYEVPTIHSSISTKGSSDVTFCKPNLIHFVHSVYGMPVLYVDADVVFRDRPDKVFQFARQRTDFACYNWLADNATDAYVPATVALNGSPTKNRFYRFSHSIDLFDPTQLMASGASQYYTQSAEPLLRHWLDAITLYPQAADDELLDFSYNFSIQKNSIRAFWWTMDYCRISWWINVRPIIDHPQAPGGGGPRSFKFYTGRERFKQDSLQVRPAQGPFPRDCLIDTKEKRLFRVTDRGTVVSAGLFDTELWVGAESKAQSAEFRVEPQQTSQRLGRARARLPSP